MNYPDFLMFLNVFECSRLELILHWMLTKWLGQLWISRNEKTNLEFKKSGWCLPALHISHIPLAKRALWLSFITKIMIKIAQNSPVQHKNTRNQFYFLVLLDWYWPKALKGVEHGRLWSNKKFRGAFQFEGLYRKKVFLKNNFAKKFE